MPVDAEKLRVLIPTTSGTVEVLLLTEEDPSIRRSVACIGGTTETADIAAAYNAFVARPTGIIEELFGHPCYRLDVSGPIDAGSSWQLGILIAHALHAVDRLAQEKDTHAGVIWATGSVRPVDLTVGPVSHIPEKIANSIDRLKHEAAAGQNVLMAVPDENATSIAEDMRDDLTRSGIEVVELRHVQALWDKLALTPPTMLRGVSGSSAASQTVSIQRPMRLSWSIGLAALALFGIAAGVYLLGRSPMNVTAERASPQPPDQRETLLVPEMVPFVSDRDQATIRAAYVPAPDHKALAVSSSHMAFVTSQPDKTTAETAAVTACQAITDSKRARLKIDPSRCELYASGNFVVTKRGRPPMPRQPWIMRDPSTETPFAPNDVPLVRERTRQLLARTYEKRLGSKALAISATGMHSSYADEPNIEQAARRALERCGYHAGVACMIIALDDVFIVPIPKTVKVVGFFHPDALNAVSPELREDIVRRIGGATRGWNAVAVGASGQVGMKLKADSEQAAIDESLQQCNRRDRECRVAVLGPFLVETGPSKMQAPSPVPSASKRPSQADTSRENTP
jgi:hypothetical protein